MRIAKFLAVILLSACPLFAQVAATPEIGANPFKSYSGGAIDHIAMDNGSPYIRIPLVSFPQLGKLSLSFSLLANGTHWTPVGYCEPNYGDCNYSYGYNYICGDKYWDGTGPGYSWSTGAAADVTLMDDQLIDYCASYSQTLYDPSTGAWCNAVELVGCIPTTSNPFSLYYDWWTFNIYDDSNASHGLGYASTDYSKLYANDGSGYKLSFLGLSGDISQVGAPNSGYVITEPSGITHQITPSGSTRQIKISDLNGNQINATGIGTPSASYLDSVGRVIPSLNALSIGYSPSTVGCPNLQIAGQSAIGSRTWTVPGPNGQQATYLFCYTNVPVLTNFFGLEGGTQMFCDPYTQYDLNGDPICINDIVTEGNGTSTSLQSAVLPDGTYWGFGYDTTATGTDRYGDMTLIRFPSGGRIEYTYDMVQECGQWGGVGNGNPPLGRGVVQRIAYPLVGPNVARTYSYSATKTVETDAEGNQTVHNFTLDYPAQYKCGSSETSTQWYQGPASNTKTPLKEVNTTYQASLDPQDMWLNTYRGYINRVPVSKTTLFDGIVTSSESYGYDSAFTDTQTMDQWRADTGIPVYSVAPVSSNIVYQNATSVNDGIRLTATTRLATIHPEYAALNAIDRPGIITIADSSTPGSPLATTTYGYDAAANQTSVSKALAGSADIVTSTAYNSLGMPTSTTDPMGNQGAGNHTTTFNYGSQTYPGLYITSRVQPPTNGTPHTDYFSQDPDTGLLTAYADMNASSISDTAHRTSYSYDIVGRLSDVIYPDGGELKQCYTDTGGSGCSQSTSPPYSVSTSKLQDVGVWETSQVNYDGLGRVYQNLATSDPQGTIFKDTTYDDIGNLHSVSNPYRTGTEITAGLTSYTYDGIGRKLIELHPDSTVSQWTYAGNTTTSTDEASKSWLHTVDARGRLVGVVEPSTTTTAYTYSALDNLMNVTQSGVTGETARTRTFSFDSLSRLVSATNPETGSVSYSYTNGGSLCAGDVSLPCTKTDARGVLLNYAYDPLNRLTSKSSSDGTVNDAYYYDNQWFTAPNSNGHLTVADHTNVSGTSFIYDTMGRVISSGFSTPATPWTGGTTTAYDLAGDPTQTSYPDGRVITQTFDTAGRLAKVSSPSNGSSPAFDYISGTAALTGNTGPTSSGGITYTPAGVESSFVLGSNIVQSNGFNNRLQPCQIQAAFQLPSTTLTLTLADKRYYYAQAPETLCQNASQNNGNIWSIADNLVTGLSQTFGYDSLNRLTSASRADNGYSYHYNIDSFGNMKPIDQINTPVTYSFDPATNRMQRNTADFQYDLSGNLTSSLDALGTNLYRYNALNQIYDVNYGNTAGYAYNGSDERAFKWVPGTSTWTDYVYLNGQPMAELSSNGTWTDYIYANGKKIAKTTNSDTRLHASGTTVQSGYELSASIPIPSNYIVKTGDTISWRQYNAGVVGGINVQFTNGSQTAWHTADYGGQGINQDFIQGGWQYRSALLTDFSGATISSINLLKDLYSPVGSWSMYVADISILSVDGTVTPIYVGQTSPNGIQPIDSSYDTSFNVVSETVPLLSDPTYGVTPTYMTKYYLSDQVGTTQMELSSGGWPLWQEHLMPYGGVVADQTANQATDNHYKFTGKERDTESGLDYFGARYYGSNMGRWMSPDWADKPEAVPYSDLDNPQSLNLYGYVNNNPLSHADPDGHAVGVDDAVEVGAVVVIAGASVIAAYEQTPAGQRSIEKLANAASENFSSNIQSLKDTVTGWFSSKTGAPGAGEKTNTGPKAADAPTVTAGGQAANEYGKKTGPSGKTQVNEVDHSGKKAAKDAARNRGKGEPEKHPSPKKGKPHYHSTDADGQKEPSSTHHNY